MAVDIAVYGAPYSVYTRIVRLVLEEKALPYRLIETDIFGKDRNTSEHFARHPFGRIPAVEIDGLALFETSAIARYVDEQFSGSSLQPTDPPSRAHMNQIISIMDSYGFRAMVWDVWVEQVRKPARGEACDEAVVAAGLAKANVILDSIDRIRSSSAGFAGPATTLADLWVAPMLILFDLAPEGRRMVDSRPAWRTWLDEFNKRPSALRTRFPVEVLSS
jgi:glutathione S-transferase